jgi:hypothetical protein
VYVDHTGPLSWVQRAWAAVLVHWPSALAGGSALAAEGMPGYSPPGGPIETVIAHGRRVDEVAGVDCRTTTSYASVVHDHRSPPRTRVEHAAITVAARANTTDTAVAVLGDVCQTRRTTASRLLEALEHRTRLRHRALLRTVLTDVAAGSCSALERRYLSEVERAHGLPAGERQRRVVTRAGITYRDVHYVRLHTVVELDGRLGHTAAADRAADAWRDLASAADDETTLRVGWVPVLSPCRLALAVGAVLRAKGWSGRVRRCSADCPARDRGGCPAPGAGDPPLSAA